MTASSTGASRLQYPSFNIPVLLAMSAAILLSLSSAAVNVGSAVARHPDTLGKLVSGGIALAVTGLLLVALPACLSSIRDRNWTTAAIAGLAWTMAAAFSISAALGTLGKPRLESAMHTAADDKARSRLEAERTRATGELATLAPARPAAELNGQLATLLATPGLGSPACAVIDGPQTRKTCPMVAKLQEETARADRRSALSGQITRVDGELRSLGKPSIASPDAAAIVAVLAVLGIASSVETLNVVLLLIGVAILEVGPGIAAALATSMRTVAPSVPSMRDITPAPVSVPLEPVASVPAIISPAAVPAVPAPSQTVQAASERIVRLVRENGGMLKVASKRELGRLAECSHPTASRALAALAGVVTVAASADGVALKLVA